VLGGIFTSTASGLNTSNQNTHEGHS